MKTVIITAIAAAALLTAGVGAFTWAKSVSPVSWGWYGNVHSTDGLALRGMDPVSLVSGSPAEGLAAFTAHHSGVDWRFATAENQALFEAAPAAYRVRPRS